MSVVLLLIISALKRVSCRSESVLVKGSITLDADVDLSLIQHLDVHGYVCYDLNEVYFGMKMVSPGVAWRTKE